MEMKRLQQDLKRAEMHLLRLNNSKYRQNVEVKETIENLTEQDVKSLIAICRTNY